MNLKYMYILIGKLKDITLIQFIGLPFLVILGLSFALHGIMIHGGTRDKNKLAFASIVFYHGTTIT